MWADWEKPTSTENPRSNQPMDTAGVLRVAKAVALYEQSEIGAQVNVTGHSFARSLTHHLYLT
jgi:hypothetical protein